MAKKLSKELKRYLESELRDYKDNKKKIEELRNDIIEESPNMTLGTPPSKNKGNEVQTVKVHKLMTNTQINRLTTMCTAIENALSRLNDTQYEFYIRCFEKGQSKVKICIEMPIGEATFHRYKNKIICLLAENLGYVIEK